jgi:hypothetical protein
MIKGTKAENIIAVLHKIPEMQRKKVKEVTLDMAGLMNLITSRCFPKASKVIDLSMCRNWPTMLYRKCALLIVGTPLMRKPMK